MRALIQRVTQASVSINNNIISEIKQGLLILVCAMSDDNEVDAEKMASKISRFCPKISSIRSSMVDWARNRVTITGPAAPIRWARLIA